jgi:GNAT superfamily N-acetyltransferase
MSLAGNRPPTLEVHPLTVQRWDDLEDLFGPRGCGGCWCMWWRLKRSTFEEHKGEGNRQAFKAIVEAGRVPGLLAYAAGQAVGWCAVAPRESYMSLERSRILKRVDAQPVWSVVCFFVRKGYRRQGVTTALLRAAVEYVREQGGSIIEGYPVEPRQGQMPDPFVYTGLASTFRKVGFVECQRRSETRPIMRLYL